MISIIIVTHNAMQWIKHCLESVCEQAYPDFEVICVDNGSADATVTIVRQQFSSVTVVCNAENRGFCAANNQGIALAKGGYILTLNSDCVLTPDFLEHMMRGISKAAPRAGMFSGKILRMDKRTIDSTGLILTKAYRFFDRGSDEKDNGQYDREEEIFGPCGAAALYKKEMLEDIKENGHYFDERFFFLLEDFDIALRARKKGWKAQYIPEARCYHARNSTNFNKKFRQYLSFRNRYFLMLKHEAFTFSFLPCFFSYDIPRMLYMFVANRYTIQAVKEVFCFTRM